MENHYYVNSSYKLGNNTDYISQVDPSSNKHSGETRKILFADHFVNNYNEKDLRVNTLIDETF